MGADRSFCGCFWQSPCLVPMHHIQEETKNVSPQTSCRCVEVHNQVHIKRPLFIDVNLKRMWGEGSSCLNTDTFVFPHCNSTPIAKHWKEKLYSLQWVLAPSGGSWGSPFFNLILKQFEVSLWGSDWSFHHYLPSTKRKMLSLQGHIWGDGGWARERSSHRRELNKAMFLTLPRKSWSWLAQK